MTYEPSEGNEDLHVWLNPGVSMVGLIESGKERLIGQSMNYSSLCPYVFAEKAAPFFWVQGGCLPHGRMSFLHISFLKFLQLEIFNNSKHHIWVVFLNPNRQNQGFMDTQKWFYGLLSSIYIHEQFTN